MTAFRRAGVTRKEVRTPWGLVEISGGETAVDWCIDRLVESVKPAKPAPKKRKRPT